MRIRKQAFEAGEWMKAHRQEFVRDLMGLMRIPSVANYGADGYAMGKACHEAAEYLVKLARGYGLEAENLGDHCVSIFLSGKMGEEMGMLGHLDVVEAGGGWMNPPFEPMEKNGWVIGRGACDNKGPLMMALYVLRYLKERRLPLHCGVRLIAGCDEEKEMRDMRCYLQHRKPPAFTLNCDGQWPVGIAEKGILTAEVSLAFEEKCLLELNGGTALNMVPDSAFAVRETGEMVCAKGKAAHCQAPSLGENAIEQLLRRLYAEPELKKLGALLPCFAQDGSGLHIHFEDAWGKTTCVPVLIRLEDGQVILSLNIRHAPTQPYERLVKALNKRCTELGLSWKMVSYSPPRVDEPNRPEIRLLYETCREVLGVKWKPYATGGGTHSRLFPNSVPFGVGIPGAKNPFGGPHEPNEAVCIAHLISGLQVYVAALFRLDERIFDGLRQEKNI